MLTSEYSRFFFFPVSAKPLPQGISTDDYPEASPLTVFR